MKCEADFQRAIFQNMGTMAMFSTLEPKQCPGFPDLAYTVASFTIGDEPYGKTGVIELKWGTVAKPPRFRPAQIQWWRRHHAHGGAGMVWTATPTGVFVHCRDRIPIILENNLNYLEWIQCAHEKIAHQNPDLWSTLLGYLIMSRSDGRSRWNQTPEGPPTGGP